MNNDEFEYDEEDLKEDYVDVPAGYDYDILEDDGECQRVNLNFECPRCHYINHLEIITGSPGDELGGTMHEAECDNCGKGLILVYTG